MRRSWIVVSALLAASSVACSKKEEEGAAPAASSVTTSTSASAAPPSLPQKPAEPAGESKCAAIGCKGGDGSFVHRCDCEAARQNVPFAAKYTGKYNSFFKQPEWDVTNKTDKDINWASANVYYYDKTGKQLEATLKDKSKFKSYRVNGSTFTIKPKETRKMTIGFMQEEAPAGAASLEVVFDGWCYGAPADIESPLCIDIERSPDERKRSGK